MLPSRVPLGGQTHRGRRARHLPDCVSSVYVFYDPDYNDGSSARSRRCKRLPSRKRLRLRWKRWISHYYMGFYIHTCQKMKYKADTPQPLLDCSSYTWHHLTDVAAELEAKRYFAWSQGDNPQSNQASPSDDGANHEDVPQEDRAARVPTEPRPPPGMLNAPAILSISNSFFEEPLLAGTTPHWICCSMPCARTQKQAEGIKPLLVSCSVRFYQGRN